jgi:phosphodiesterase/alkaline phosphatase D-like protein
LKNRLFLLGISGLLIFAAAQSSTSPLAAATLDATQTATTSATIATAPTLIATAAPYATAALTTPFAYGVAAGDMTSDSAILWTRTPAAANVIPELSLTQDFANPQTLAAVQTTDATDFTVKVTVTGLKPGTQYYYRFHAGSDISPVGAFKTAYAADQNSAVTFAFSGDADWKWKPYPVLNALIKEKLDYFLFLGDLLYETSNMAGTTSVEDLAGYRFKYRENREPRANSATGMVPMKDLYANFGQYSVFDNHETGLSKADKNAPSYNEGGASANGVFVNQSQGFKDRIQAYREYQPVTDDLNTGTGDPRVDQTYKFYRTAQWGANVKMIVLDDRSYRDSRPAKADDPGNASCDRTMLGKPQLQWFESELLAAQKAKTTWKVIVISSPLQQLGTASEVGGDLDSTKSWPGAYACERSTILKFIDDNAIDNVVFLTTDNHYTVINNLKYNSDPKDPKSALKSARNAIEILTGPLGASSGNPSGLKVDTKGLSRRDADRKILDVWNGDAPNTDGKLAGLKQSGLDPIGLEGDFPGLVTASISADGGQPGVVAPIDFASFNTFSYAVLTFDQTSLTVTVKGIPNIPDPSVLTSADTEKEYENRQTAQILTFQIKAQ